MRRQYNRPRILISLHLVDITRYEAENLQHEHELLSGVLGGLRWASALVSRQLAAVFRERVGAGQIPVRDHQITLPNDGSIN